MKRNLRTVWAYYIPSNSFLGNSGKEMGSDKSRAYEVVLVASGNPWKAPESCGRSENLSRDFAPFRGVRRLQIRHEVRFWTTMRHQYLETRGRGNASVVSDNLSLLINWENVIGALVGPPTRPVTESSRKSVAQQTLYLPRKTRNSELSSSSFSSYFLEQFQRSDSFLESRVTPSLNIQNCLG